jgi:hypothetical protein
LIAALTAAGCGRKQADRPTLISVQAFPQHGLPVSQNTTWVGEPVLLCKDEGLGTCGHITINHNGNFMKEDDLKAENTALRKQNKNLKALLEEALELIRKLKEFVDSRADARAAAGPAKAKRKTASKAAAKKTAKSAKSTGKAS